MIREKELLTPERLVRSGRETLYEAVNTGRLVAFVGSGLSLVYGQPTWAEFIKSLRGKLEAAITEAEGGRRLSPAEAGRMRAMAGITDIKDSDSLVTLELIRRAYALIQSRSKATSDNDLYRRDLQSLFTFNAIALGLLSKRLAYSGVSITDLTLAGDAGEAELASVYNTRTFERLAKIGDNEKLVGLVDSLRAEPCRVAPPTGKNKDRALPIDRRSALAILLAHCQGSPGEVSNAIRTTTEAEAIPRPPSRPLLDPLRELDEWLRLRRYLSTNYDLGLEDQHMVARGEAPLTPNALKRHNIEISDDDHALTCQHRNGRVVRSDVNDGLHVAPLFDFALGGVDNSVHIYHLHGRVDQPETIIAADGEYNRLYRSEGFARTAFDHAYDTLIVGNPILFVGSGLTEAELNRVLRANVSNPDLLRAAPSIVLREAVKPQRELLLDQTQLATKLGVRVVYTGHARRGAVYTLRDHLLLVDYLASRYGLVDRHSRRGEKHKDPPYSFRTGNPDFSKVKFSKDANDTAATIEKLIQDRFRLLWDLDYDRKIVAWLIQYSPTSPPKRKYNAVDSLIADYLGMLAQKLVSAALRHELRQIGHEAVEHYRERATPIKARRSFAEHGSKLVTRHISQIQTLALPDNSKADASTSQYVAKLIVDSNRSAPNKVVNFDLLAKLLPHSAQCERTVILGARGIGKGKLLAKFVEDQGAKARSGDATNPQPRRLFINCCYGQEIDSIVSIIDQFLGSASADQSDDVPSRRQRIIASKAALETPPPLIVLGGVDRLFGTDGMPLSVEFEWLLDQLLDPRRRICLLATGELRCLEFFSGRLNAQEPAPGTLRSGGRKLRTGPAKLWLIAPKPAGNDPQEWGLRAKLTRIAKEAHRAHIIADDRDTRLKMAHRGREADLLIGDWLATLENGRARLAGCEADDELALEIVKACAFIGLPFEADILPSVPAIRARLRRMPHPKKSLDNPDGRVARAAARKNAEREAIAIRDALARALQLSLINLVEPFGRVDEEASENPLNGDPPKNWDSCKELADWAIENGYRLVVHRLTAKVLKDRFGVPNNAGVLSDSYNLSLYAVQPDDASVPEPRVTGELEDLIDYLMHSWKETDLFLNTTDAKRIDLRSDIRAARRGLTEDYQHDLSLHYLEALRIMRRRLCFASPLPVMGLRAAGGVIRGYYSAVNLFGLDLGDQNRAPGKVSAISEHKQRIRALLNLTIEAQIWGAKKAPFDHLNDALHCVSGIVTVDEDRDEALQTLRFENAIALLCSDSNIPEPWRRLEPVAVKALRDKVANADGATLRVAGLRTLLKLKEPAPQADKVDEAEKKDEAATSGKTENTNKTDKQVHPFFDGEIVWLLNERAMLAMAQGDLYTAATTFELAFDANRNIEGDRFHPNRARLTINRAFLWIERGSIADARRELETLSQHLDRDADAIGSHTNEGRLIAALCDGYIGLCNHLFGMMEEAESQYEKAISAFSAIRQQRAIAIFEHHRCALLRQIPGRETDAAAALQRGIAAATGGRHTDILYRLRIAKAHNQFFADPSSAAEVLATLGEAIDYGLSLEMHRVTVEALTARGLVHLKFGDVEAASRDVSRAAAKAAQYGMTLRRIWLRVVTGQVYRLRGDARNARKILERAVSEGSHIGYQRAVEVATRQLISLKTH